MATKTARQAAQEYGNAEMARQLESLRPLPFAELMALPASTTEMSKIRGRKVDVTTYRDVLADGRLRIVVQVFVRGPWFGLGFRWVTAQGFVVGHDGSVAAIPYGELYEFI